MTCPTPRVLARPPAPPVVAPEGFRRRTPRPVSRRFLARLYRDARAAYARALLAYDLDRRDPWKEHAEQDALALMLDVLDALIRRCRRREGRGGR